MLYKSYPRANPPLDDGRWIVADLHVHSTYSGGSLTPEELIKSAQMQLLDAIAITDHTETAGGIEAQKIKNSNDFGVIVSQEISLGDHFHLLVLGAEEAWTSASRNKLMEKIYQSHDAGVVIILAHPWTLPKSSWASGCLQDLLTGNLVDGVELFNASILESDRQASKTLTSIWEDLISPYHLAVVGGSDFHYHKQGRLLGVGRTYLKVPAGGGSGIPAILEAIRKRRTVAGLFNFRSINLGQFGFGTGTIWGRDPWYSELRELINSLEEQIKYLGKLNPGRQPILRRLMEMGCYQSVRDLLASG